MIELSINMNTEEMEKQLKDWHRLKREVDEDFETLYCCPSDSQLVKSLARRAKKAKIDWLSVEWTLNQLGYHPGVILMFDAQIKKCPKCNSADTYKHGSDNTYICADCRNIFDI